MKPWLKRTLIGAFGASVLLGGLAACGNRGGHGPGWHAHGSEDAVRRHAHAVDWIARELALDDAQKARLAALVERAHAQGQALIGGTDPRAQIEALVAGPAFDRASAKALIDAKTEAVARVGPELIGAVADFYDSLRPEQQEKVREFMARGRRGWRG